MVIDVLGFLAGGADEEVGCVSTSSHLRTEWIVCSGFVSAAVGLHC